MAYPVVTTAEAVTMKLSGKLGINVTGGLEEEVRALVSTLDGKALVFDLSAVDYVSSAFLRVCMMAAKGAGTGNFSVIGATPDVKKVLKIAGFDKLMTIA